MDSLPTGPISRQPEDVSQESEPLQMKMSKIIDRAERELGYSLITRRHGGASGGSCLVTEDGMDVVRRYRQLEEKVSRYAEEMFCCEYFNRSRNTF